MSLLLLEDASTLLLEDGSSLLLEDGGVTPPTVPTIIGGGLPRERRKGGTRTRYKLKIRLRVTSRSGTRQTATLRHAVSLPTGRSHSHHSLCVSRTLVANRVTGEHTRRTVLACTADGTRSHTPTSLAYIARDDVYILNVLRRTP